MAKSGEPDGPRISKAARVVRVATLALAAASAIYFLYPVPILAWKADEGDKIARASRVIQSNTDGFILVQTPRGNFWVPRGMEKVLPVFLGQQAEKIYGSGDQGAHRGDIVLDCGADVGVFTREALDLGAARVIAVESAPENVESLRRTFAEEIRNGKVTVYPKGVWDRDDVLTLYVYPDNSGGDSFVISGPSKYTEVKAPLTTIDKLAVELELARVDFIKMDIKGSAPKALAGGRQTLAKYHPRIAVSTEVSEDYPALIQGPVMAGWDGYHKECGMCELFREGFIPTVMFYR